MAVLNRELQHKIRTFLNKYYRNQILQGFIISIGVSLIVFFVLSVAEYFSYFSILTRKVIFFSYLTVTAFIVIFFILIPLLKLLGILKPIDSYSVNSILSPKIPELKDKLINILQLDAKLELSKNETSLISAAIDQKIKEIKPLDFLSVIRYKNTLGKHRFVIISLVLIIALIVFLPDIFRTPAQRLINYNIYYEEPLPFQIKLLNENLQGIQNEDFKIEVYVSGDIIPAEILLNSNSAQQKMRKQEDGIYTYTFPMVQKSFNFSIEADQYESSEYRVEIYPKPAILEYEIDVLSPAYTKREKQNIKNNGNLIIAEGAEVSWRFYTLDTDYINFYLNDSSKQELDSEKGNVFTFSKDVYKDLSYALSAYNRYHNLNDSLHFNISVIPDQYPQISVRRDNDSNFVNFNFFTGQISDDYGFRKLIFKANLLSEGSDEIVKSISEPLEISKDQAEDIFFYQFNLDEIDIEDDEFFICWFEITDNDQINNFKTSVSEKFRIEKKSKDDIKDAISGEQDQNVNNLEKSIKDIMDVNKDIEDLIEELINKEEISWSDKQKVESLLKKQEEIYKKVEESRNSINKNYELEKQQFEVEERIIEKQLELEKLFDEVLDEETKKLMEELNELMEEFSKEQLMNKLEDMKMSNEDLERALDRNIELFKQLELEKSVNEAVEKLDKMIEKQEEIIELTEEKAKDADSLAKMEEGIEKEFDQLKEDLKDIEQKNEDLEQSYEMPELEEEQQKIDQDMQESMDQLNKGKYKKATQSQKEMQKGLKNMREQVFQFMQQMQSQQLGEDIQVLREILENLVSISFDQEDLMLTLKNIDIDDPSYIEIGKEQRRIGDDAGKIKDSLFALSKRQMAIADVVNKEIASIDNNIGRTLNLITERHQQHATTRQQMVITSFNNLALLLAEALRNMENNMAMQNQMQGKSNCSQPGGGKSKSKSLSQMQKELNDQLQKMKDQMGQNKGKSPKGKGSMSKEMAKMAAQQEMLRNAMQKHMDELEEYGINDHGLEKALGDMDKTEEELINKIINQETINRQKDILTRLLKSEKALHEREKDEKRKSKEAKIYEISNPSGKLEYKEDKIYYEQLLNLSNKLKMKEFYRNKILEYQRKLNTSNVSGDEIQNQN